MSKESSSIPRVGTASKFALSSEDMIPNDFVGLGVAVAVKKPVSICVVVVTVTLPVVWDCDEDVAEEVAELQSLASSYRMPLMITPSPSTICCFWSPLQVSGIFRCQQVADGEGGREFVCVAFSGPVVLYKE